MNKLNQATLEIQQLGALRTDGKNPHFKSLYVTLPTLINHITPILHKHGLVMRRETVGLGEGTIGVFLSFNDIETGEMVKTTPWVAPVAKANCQSYGAVNTYATRMAILNYFNLPVEDHDAEEERVNYELSQPLSDEDNKQLIELLMESGMEFEHAETAASKVFRRNKQAAFAKAHRMVREYKGEADVEILSENP